MNAVLSYCRAGFEKDVAAELEWVTSQKGIYGYARIQPNSGYVIFECYQEGDADRIVKEVSLSSLVFSRQLLRVLAQVDDMDTQDRIGELFDALSDVELSQGGELSQGQFGDVWVEHPDTTDGRELSKFCRKFTVPTS